MHGAVDGDDPPGASPASTPVSPSEDVLDVVVADDAQADQIARRCQFGRRPASFARVSAYGSTVAACAPTASSS